MPSLVPKTKTIDPPDDYREILTEDQFQLSRGRVLAYIKHFESGFSKRSWEDIKRPDVITERFVIDMPTQEAYMAEIELCAAIKAHAGGELTDEQLKAVTEAYIASHIVCHQGGRHPWAKVGELEHWTWKTVPLFYVSSCLQDGWTCNMIQALILREIYSDRNFMIQKL